jgi:hypothetical protein
MRRHQTRKILELLATLREAYFELKHLFSHIDTIAIIKLLSECQETALELGNFIESIVGEGTQTVSLLEDYCELLYQVGIDINITNTGYLRQLQHLLDKIENSANIELEPDKMEIVFLPYKASMFDTFESIWLAAKDDPQCETHVVPIPYYERLPDGTFGNMQYERSLYPDYVPVEDWQSYDIEKRHPDVIFIHNPYDEHNHVTSVHPYFYSKRLCDFTDCLVYVPYFLLPGRFEEDFAMTPGVLYSHKVIVQNDMVRDGYIRTLLKRYKEFNREDVEKRIIAMGSPKTDRFFSNKSDVSIPLDWIPKIENKVIILFNTSINLILKNSENFIENLLRIFKTLFAHKDYAVIWREHPLTYATLQSMRPEFVDDYLKLRQMFLANNYGVIDETPDPYTAIKLSDCYFGAGGSLSALYPITGKPLMVMCYNYPDGLSNTKISLEKLLSGTIRRLMYYERNINALELYLENLPAFEAQSNARKAMQAACSYNLDGTVGEKIYSHIKESCLHYEQTSAGQEVLIT